jgi:hypothetical protein
MAGRPRPIDPPRKRSPSTRWVLTVVVGVGIAGAAMLVGRNSNRVAVESSRGTVVPLERAVAPEPASRFEPRPRQAMGEPSTEQEATEVVSPTPVSIHPRHAAIVEHLDGRLRDEARSEPWASAAEKEFRDFFATMPQAEGSRLLSADCRSTLCRLRIAHNEVGALPRFLDAVGMQPPFTVAGARFPDPDEDHSVMFLARRDMTLPVPDPATLPSPDAIAEAP